MPRKGRLLEIIVEHVQRFLALDGIIVKSPELFHKNGKIVGEIDITLRGNFGSSEIFIGIECRDRPADGPQGIDWIRTIRGKQEHLKVDKMIAVSSTGFRPEAIELANDFRIDLLVLEDINRIDLEGWFRSVDFSWQEEQHTISGIIDIKTIPETAVKTISLRMDIPFLKLHRSDPPISLEDFIKIHLDDLFANLPQITAGEIIANTIIEYKDHIDAELEGKKFTIIGLSIPLELSREIIEGKMLLNICHRPENNDAIALTGICTVKTRNRVLKILAVAKKNKLDTSTIDLRFHFFNDDNELYLIPKGTKFSLYGMEGIMDAE